MHGSQQDKCLGGGGDGYDLVSKPVGIRENLKSLSFLRILSVSVSRRNHLPDLSLFRMKFTNVAPSLEASSVSAPEHSLQYGKIYSRAPQ